jgi:hypothetical protein
MLPGPISVSFRSWQHSKFNFLEKKLGETTNEPVAVATQPRAPHPKYKVDMFFLRCTSEGL